MLKCCIGKITLAHSKYWASALIFLYQIFVSVENISRLEKYTLHCYIVRNEFLDMHFFYLSVGTDGYFFLCLRFLNFYSEYRRQLFLRVINITAKCTITETYYCYLLIQFFSLGCHGKATLT